MGPRLAKQRRLGRETVRLLIKNEFGVMRVRLEPRRALTRYSVPESVDESTPVCSILFASSTVSRRRTCPPRSTLSENAFRSSRLSHVGNGGQCAAVDGDSVPEPGCCRSLVLASLALS